MTPIDVAKNLRGSTRLLYDELLVQHAQPTILSVSLSLIEYTDKRGDQRLLFSTCSDKSSATGRIIARSKPRTALIADYLSIPMPATVLCSTIRDAYKFKADFPVIVTKPVGSAGGKGVSTNIERTDDVRQAYSYAKEYSNQVIAQQHVDGHDVRLLIIDGTFSSAVIRKPATVVGDGTSTILELITTANTTSPRSDPAFLSILPIKLQSARRYLGDTLHTIPALGHIVRTTGPANVSLGGSLHEATHSVTQAMIADAEKISKKLDLGICGVDMMWNEKLNKHYLIEVNATPGIDIHNDPFSGTKSDCAQRYVTWLIA